MKKIILSLIVLLFINGCDLAISPDYYDYAQYRISNQSPDDYKLYFYDDHTNPKEYIIKSKKSHDLTFNIGGHHNFILVNMSDPTDSTLHEEHITDTEIRDQMIIY